jgi:polyhydroxyalkanoate synthesis regulator phasin
MELTKRKLAAAGAALAVVGGGGAAIAATQFSSPQERDSAIVSDAAKQLGVQPQALSDALKKALEDRVDEAVAAGRLTKEQGDALKQRIESGDVPLFSGPGGFRGDHGPFGHDLDAAATYVGLTEEQLRTQLASGKTLADIAKAQGKSVDGLVDTLVAEFKQHLDAAVAAGRLTQSQADQVLTDVRQRITDRVNGKAPEYDGARPQFFAPPPVGPVT